MEYIFRTDVGQLRSHNEDSGGIFKNESGILALVADGMGGHRAGDVASTMAKDYFQSLWEKGHHFSSVQGAEEWIRDHVKQLNALLHTHSSKHLDCQGMGTTLVIAICTEEFITIGHIGDSRAYIKNEFGFNQKTSDHSLVQELVNSGQISEEEAEHHPRKNILLRALGTEPEIKVDVMTIQVEGGQVLLLCSDGLSNKISLDELRDHLDKDSSLSDKADQLISLANERGGEDNISVAIVQFPSNMNRLESEQ